MPPPPAPPPVANRGDPLAGWIQEVAAMPAQEQVKAVAAKLKDLNPGFDGQVTPQIERGVVTQFAFSTDRVTNITPLRALTGVTTLGCSGSNWHKGQLVDLEPLRGMRLTRLNFWANKVADLSPLVGMKLTSLDCSDTAVTDLGPLKGMPLERLNCRKCSGIQSLAPLQGMPLTRLDCSGTRVSDLTSLHGMKLDFLSVAYTPVADLSPLQGMKLTELGCKEAKVTDLSALRGMPLKTLWCDFQAERDAAILRSLEALEQINDKSVAEFWKAQGKVLDEAWLKKVRALTPAEQDKEVAARLKDLNPGFDGRLTRKIEPVGVRIELVTDHVTNFTPLRALTGVSVLSCAGSTERKGHLVDLDTLRVMQVKGLNILCTDVDDLAPLAGMKLFYIDCSGTAVTDLEPLRGMPMEYLYCQQCPGIKSLAPLEGMPLKHFHCATTGVADLAPLAGMKLERFWISSTPVTDLAPLQGMELTELHCEKTKVTDLSVLRGMPLKILSCDFRAERDAAILRSIKTLEQINGKSAAEFWKEVDAKPGAQKP
jgi:Leucine-rich repeat (LRR) protein